MPTLKSNTRVAGVVGVVGVAALVREKENMLTLKSRTRVVGVVGVAGVVDVTALFWENDVSEDGW